MTETVEWLRERIRYSDEYEIIEVLVKDLASIADEIERLREALRRLAALDEFVNGEPTSIEEVMNYTQYVARSALEDKR